MSPNTRQQKKSQVATRKPQEDVLASAHNHIAHALSDRSPVTTKQFAVGFFAACQKSPELIDCCKQNPKSVIQSLVECSTLKLNPAPVLRHFALIPRQMFSKVAKKKIWTCTYIVEYRGLIELANRSKMLEGIGAEVVYEGDYDTSIPFEDQLNPKTGRLSADPFRDAPPDDKIVGAYAWARVKDREGLVLRTLSRSDLNKREELSSSDVPRKWRKEWCEKTALRALLNSGRVPLGDQRDDVLRVLEHEDQVEQGVEPSLDDLKPADVEVREVEEPPKTEQQRRDEEPFPDEDQVRKELFEDLREKASDEEVGQKAAEMFGSSDPAEMGLSELRKLRDAL